MYQKTPRHFYDGKDRGIPKMKKRAYILAAVLGLLYVIQFAIPSGYILPRSYVDSQNVGLRDEREVLKELVQKSSNLEIAYGNKRVSVPASEAGITADAAKTLRSLPALQWKDRLVPFKPLYLSLKVKSVQPIIKIDERKLRLYAERSSNNYMKKPIEATATVKEGRLAITDDVPGAAFEPRKITKAMAGSNPFTDTPIKIVPTALPAKTQRKELEPLTKSFSAKTAFPLQIVYGTTSKTFSPDEYKKWLKVVQVPPNGSWELQFDAVAVEAQTQVWAKEYNVSPGTTQVSYLDDIETSRKSGAAGRALDTEAIKLQFAKWLDAPSEAPVTLAAMTLAPQVIATRTYSYTSAQLQAKLNAWISSHPGKYQVAIRELNGRGREASYNVAQQTVMASTYKTFLAFAAYRQAENGALDLGSPLHNGRNIEQCIEFMIVNSDNDCAVKLGRHIGWAKVDQIIAAAGFEGTTLNNYDANGNLNGDKLVNASQQARFLAQLSGGSLINSANKDRLMGYMKRQVYRNGIPAGSRGAVVADKVGFLDNYLHDVGIVYSPKSTYAIVIMSEGSSWSNIRDLAEAVYEFMSQ